MYKSTVDTTKELRKYPYVPRNPLGQNLMCEIRGVKHLGHWIRRSDVGQIAPQTEPNPRYRRIGSKSDLFNDRGNNGQL